MKFTLEHARQQALQVISSTIGAIEATIIDGATQQYDVGWVFFYQSSRFLETGNARDCPAGNAPLFVSREEGQSAFIRYHRPIAESIDAYRACGDANACEEPRITIDRWLHGAKKIQAVMLIRQYSHLNLADAKYAVDHCLASGKVLVDTKDVASAKQLVRELAKIGFIGAVTYRKFDRDSGPRNDC